MEGSSNISNFGEDARPRPIANICCSPPDKVPAICSRRSANRGNQSRIFSKFSFQFSRPASVLAPNSKFSMTVKEGKTWRPSGTWAMPKWGRCAAGISPMSTPSNRIDPALGLSTPEMVLNNVDLPAPLGPTTATNCPSLTCIDTSRRTGIVP